MLVFLIYEKKGYYVKNNKYKREVVISYKGWVCEKKNITIL